MASKTQIANEALSLLGEVGQISSLSDSSQAAQLANLLFESVVKDISVRGHFTSTITRATLTNTGTSPEYEYNNQYNLPNDPLSLKVLDINYGDIGDYDYSIEGDYLYTDASSVKIKYVGYLTNSGNYDEQLRRAVTYELAARMAKPLTGSSRFAAGFRQEADRIIQDSISLNNQQGKPKQVRANDYLDVR